MGIKVRVKAGMAEGFFGFYNSKGGVGKRYFAGRDGAPGEESFEIDSESHYSTNWMECLDDSYEVVDGELVEKRKKPGPKPKTESAE